MKNVIGFYAAIAFTYNHFKLKKVKIKVGTFNEATATEKEKEEDKDVFFYIPSPEYIGLLMDRKNEHGFYVTKAEPIYEQVNEDHDPSR